MTWYVVELNMWNNLKSQFSSIYEMFLAHIQKTSIEWGLKLAPITIDPLGWASVSKDEKSLTNLFFVRYAYVPCINTIVQYKSMQTSFALF